MTAPIALPASTGPTVSGGPSSQPKQPPQPTVKPQAPQPLAMASQQQNTQQQATVPIPQTADPLAFSANTNTSQVGAMMAPGAPGGMTGTGTLGTPGQPANGALASLAANAGGAVPPTNTNAATAVPNTMTPEQWQAYSPIEEATRGLTGAAREKALTDYWAGQGTQGLAHVGNSFDAKGAYDPTLNAQATAAYKANNAADIDAITKAVTGNQAGALTATNAGQNVTNLAQANTDADADIAQRIKEGATGDQSQVRAEILRNSGFGADGSFLGAPENHATPGMPANYKPSELPNNGWVDDGGNYHVGPATGSAQQAGGNTTNPTTNPVALSQIDPNNSLIGQQITPGQNIDRTKIFQDSLNSTIKNVIDPSYEADARQLNRYNFGAGRGVSGAARTSQGDLAAARDRRIADLSAQGIADATRGNIDDYWRSLDETQQERGYQSDRADTAFNQDAELAQLNEMLTNGAFGRAAQQQSAGYKDSPEDIALILSKIFGDQSSAAGKAAAESFRNAGSGGGSGGGGSYEDILKLIASFRNGGGAGSTTGNQATEDDGQ